MLDNVIFYEQLKNNNVSNSSANIFVMVTPTCG